MSPRMALVVLCQAERRCAEARLDFSTSFEKAWNLLEDLKEWYPELIPEWYDKDDD